MDEKDFEKWASENMPEPIGGITRHFAKKAYQQGLKEGANRAVDYIEKEVFAMPPEILKEARSLSIDV